MHYKSLHLVLALLVGASCLAGCGGPCPQGPIVPDSEGIAPKVDYAHLDKVLGRVVTRDGLVSRVALEESAKDLDAQLALLAITGPTATPALLASEDDRLAYWYNARAAWSMKLILSCNLKNKLDQPGALFEQQFKLDGRLMSLSDIDAILRADSDWRTMAAAPCVSLERAPMPQKAFGPQGIRSTIAERFNQFVADPNRFVVDVDNKRMIVPKLVWDMRSWLIEQYEQQYHTTGTHFLTSLLPYLHGSALRKVQDARGYEVQPRGRPLLLALAGKFDFWFNWPLH